MTTIIRRLLELVTQTYESWRNDRTIRLGAGLAYYGLFTIVPLLALTAAFAELLFGAVDMQTYLEERLEGVGISPGGEASAALTEQLNQASVQTSLGLFGLGSLLFAASLVFAALNDAVNVIWAAPVETGVWESIRRRAISFVMVLFTGAVLIAGFALSAVAGAAQSLLSSDSEILDDLAGVLTNSITVVLLAITVTLLLRLLSPATVRWRVAIGSGVATAVVLVLSTLAVAWYLSTFGGRSVTGAFASVLAVLTWIYFEAQILLAGVQLSKVITLRAPALDAASEANPADGQ